MQEKIQETSQLNLVEFVSKATWKEVLLELIAENQLDPWNINIAEIAQKYLESVKKMQVMDLRVPANVILASALLLRFKAEALELEDGIVMPEETGEARQLIDEEIPELVRIGIARKRQMTLDELVNAIDDIIGVEEEIPFLKKFAPKNLDIKISGEGMHEQIKEVYNKLHKEKDSEGIVLFSRILPEKSRESFVKTLMPVLHLVQEHKVIAWQDKEFGEIFIKVLASPEKEAVVKKPETLVKKAKTG